MMTDVERIKAVYNFGKMDHLPRREFYIWEKAKERWRKEGWDGDLSVFKYDHTSGMTGWFDDYSDPFRQPLDLGWTDAPVMPRFEEKILKTRDGYEYLRTRIGGILMFPVGKREGVMPVFTKAPVECRDDWYNIIKPRLDPETPERWCEFDVQMSKLKIMTGEAKILFDAKIIGGYMYLRSLCGPEKLLYIFYDDPDLIHNMMKTWLHLQITCLIRMQDHIPFFKLFFGEDIAYKTGTLISPKMAEEFLFPYYRELIQNLRSRQKYFIHVEVDTDGNPDVLLPLYIKNGFTAWSPCEVAAIGDIVEMAKKYPNLVMRGGIDKRILSRSKDDIRRELDRILPFMGKRGGYIPTCDHGIPDDVPFENYLFYREYITGIDSF